MGKAERRKGLRDVVAKALVHLCCTHCMLSPHLGGSEGDDGLTPLAGCLERNNAGDRANTGQDRGPRNAAVGAARGDRGLKLHFSDSLRDAIHNLG